MQPITKILGGVCAILFVITGVTALLLFNLDSKAFASETYKQAFVNQKLYDQMPGILANALTNSINGDVEAGVLLKSFTVQNWESIISSLLPPEELKTLTDNALDSIFDYLNGKTDSANISLLPFKKYIVSPTGVEAVLGLMRAQPDCTFEQVMQMTLGALTGGGVALCNPPEEAVGLMTPLIEAQLQVMTIAIPDQITLIPSERKEATERLRSRLNIARVVMKLSPLFPLLFLLGITLFAVRSLVGWLKWWGLPLMTTGVIGILIAVPGSAIFGFVLGRVIQSQGNDSLPPILLTTMSKTLSDVAGRLLKPVAIEGLILTLVGLVMIIVSIFLTKRTLKPQSSAAGKVA